MGMVQLHLPGGYHNTDFINGAALATQCRRPRKTELGKRYNLRQVITHLRANRTCGTLAMSVAHNRVVSILFTPLLLISFRLLEPRN